MTLHIVTSRCFLACEKVTFIKLEGVDPTPTKQPEKPKKPKRGRPKKKEEVVPKSEFRIVIGYYPVTLSTTNYGNREPSEYTLELTLEERQKAIDLYAEIVKEVQEQHPNELYLDQLVSKLLAGDSQKVEEPATT